MGTNGDKTYANRLFGTMNGKGHSATIWALTFVNSLIYKC